MSEEAMFLKHYSSASTSAPIVASTRGRQPRLESFSAVRRGHVQVANKSCPWDSESCLILTHSGVDTKFFIGT